MLDFFNWSMFGITCLFMLLDIITGFTQALYNKRISSTKMKDGLFHKCGFVLAIVLAGLCEYASEFLGIGINIPLMNATCVIIIAIEVVSNVENVCKLSPELANTKFPQLFDEFKNKEEK